MSTARMSELQTADGSEQTETIFTLDEGVNSASLRKAQSLQSRYSAKVIHIIDDATIPTVTIVVQSSVANDVRNILESWQTGTNFTFSEQ